MNRRAAWLLCAAFIIVSASAFPAQKHFLSTGNWSQGFRWTGGTVPVANDDIIIDSPNTCTVNVVVPNLNSLTVSSGATLNGGGFNIPVVGNTNPNAGATVSISGATSLNLAPNMSGAGATLSSASTITSLTISGGSVSLNNSIAAGITVGSFAMTAGSFDVSASNYPMSVGGNWNNSGGTFTAQNGTVTFTGSGSIQNAETFYNLSINSPATVTLAAAPTVINNLVIATGGTLSANTNGMSVGNNGATPGTFTINGTLDMSTVANPSPATTPAVVLDVFGNLGGTGAINASGYGGIRFRGTLAATVDFSGITYTPGFTRLWFCGVTTFNSGKTLKGNQVSFIRMGSTSVALGQPDGSLALSDDLILTGNDWTGSGTISIAPTPTTASAFNLGGHTVTVLNGSNPTVTLASLSPANFSSAGSTFVFSGATSLTSNACVFNNIQIGAAGALTLSDGVTLAGNWVTTAGGALTAGTNTVTFAPSGTSATISGNTTFTNLAIGTASAGKSLIFANGSTQTVTGTFSVTGVSGNQISLLSDSSPTRWNLSLSTTGTASVAWAAVKDSSATGTNTPIVPTNSTNLGNNAGWNFGGGAAIQWSGPGPTSTDWNVGGNWNLNRVPGVSDTVTIPAGTVTNPTLTSSVTVASLTITTGNLNLAGFNITVTGALTLQSGGTLQLQGQAGQTVTRGSISLLGTVLYNGAASYTGLLLGVSYASLGFSGGGTYTLNAGPLSLTGNLTFTNGSVLKLNNNNLSVGLILSGAGTLDASAGGNVTASGNVNFTGGTFTKGTGAFIFNGTTTLTSAGNSFNDITIGAGAGGSLVLSGPLSLSGTFSGAVGGTNNFDAATNTVTAGGNVILTNIASFISTGSTPALPSFIFNGTTTLTSAGKSFNNVTIGAGAGASLVLSGPLSLGGTFSGAVGGTNNFDAANTTVTAGGNVTLSNIASFISTGSTPAVPSFVFNGTTTLTSAGKSFNNITIGAGAGGTLTLFPTNATGDLVVLGAISVTAGSTTAFDTTNRTVTVAGNVTFTGLTTFTSTGSTFVFNSTTTLTSAGKSFNNITIGAGSGASLVLSGPLSLGGTFSGAVGGTNNFDAANTTVTAGGNVTLTNIASFISTGSTPAVPSFIFNGTTTLTSAAKSFNNITIGAGAGGTLTLFPTNATGDLVVLGAISVTGGGTTAFNTTSRTVTVAGNVTFTGLTTFTSTGSTFVFNGTTTLTSAGKSFNTITIGAGAGGSLVLSGPLSLSGTFSGAAGGTNNFDAANTTVTAGGNVTLTNIASFISTGSTPAVPSFVFNGTTTLTSAGKSFNNVTIGAGAGASLVLSDPLSLSGIFSGAAGGINNFDAANTTVTAGGNVTLTNIASFISTGSTPAVPSFVFNGTTTLTSAGKSFNNVTIGAGSGASLVLSGPLSLGGTFSGAVGGTNNFDAANTTVTAGGNITLTNIASFISTGSTPAVPSFVFNGTTTLTSAGKSFNNITIGAGAGGTLTLFPTNATGDLVVLGAISVTGGGTTVFDATNRTVTVAGNVTFASLTTFTSTGSTFVLNSTTTATITGSTTFNNFSCITAGKTIKFTNGTTQTINGTFTINGTATNLISLLSTTSGSKWFINNAGGAENVTFVLVQDGGVSGTNNLTAGTSRNDARNTTNPPTSPGWIFTPNTLAWTGNALTTDWNTPGNWNPQYVPNTTDNATINSAANQPLLAADTTIVNLVINTGASVGTNTHSLTLTGGLTLNGTGTLNGSASPAAITVGSNTTAAGTINLNGGSFSTTNLTVSGTLVASGSETITVGGNIDFSAAGNNFTGASSTVVMTGTGVIINASQETFANLQIGSGTGASVSLASVLSFSGTFSGAVGGTNNFDAANNVVTAGGNVTLTNIASFISTGSTPAVPSFIFNGTTTLTSAGKSFNNITIGAGSGASLVLSGPLSLGGTFSGAVGGTNNFDAANNAVTAGGNVTLTNIASFISTGSTPAVPSFIFNGTTTLTTAGKSFNNVTIGAGAGASLVLSGPLSLGGTFSGAAGGTNNFDAANNVVTAGGNVTLTNIASFISTGSTPALPSFVFNGTTTLTSAGKSFNNVTIGAGAGASLVLSGPLSLGGIFSGAAGGTNNFDAANNVVTAGGNVTLTNIASFISTGSTPAVPSFIFNGTTTLTSAGKSFNNVTIGAGSGASLVLSGPLSLGGTFSGAVGGTNNFDAANTTVTAGGNVTLTNIASFISTGSTPAVPSFVFNGTTTLTSAGKSFNNITIGAGAGGTLTLFPTNATGDLVVLGAISVTGGGTTAFDTTNRTVTVAGNVTFTGLTTFTSTGSTFVFNSTTTLTSAGKSFNNITIGAGSGASLVLSGPLSLGGTFSGAVGGTNNFDAANNTVTAGGNVTLTNIASFISTGSTPAVPSFIFNGTTTLTSAGKSFNNITIGAGAGGPLTLFPTNATGDMVVLGAIAVTGGGTTAFDTTNRTVTVAGNVTFTGLTTFTSTGSTFVFNSTTTLTSAGKSFNNITIGAGSGASLVLSGPLSLGGAFSGAVGGTNNFDAANNAVTAGGNVTLTNIASFISTGSTPAVPSFIFNGTTTLTSAGKSFNNITIGAGAGGTLTLFPTNATGDLVVLGAISVTGGGTTAFDTTNRTVTVAGNVTFTGLTTFTSTGSTFVFNGTTTLTSAGKSFNNIAIGAGREHRLCSLVP